MNIFMFLLQCISFQFQYASNFLCEIQGLGCDTSLMKGIKMQDGSFYESSDCLIIAFLSEVAFALLVYLATKPRNIQRDQILD
jgi:hypothetical protein